MSEHGAGRGPGARAMMLRENLVLLLPNFSDGDIGVMLEAVADELLSRRLPGASTVRAAGWWLLDIHVGEVRPRTPIYSGSCVRGRVPGNAA